MTDPYGTPTGQPDNQAPDSNATKADLVEHAVSQGMDRAEAEKMTKDDLRNRYPANQ